ncbi:MAG: 6-bladed beta-propeller [Gemmatimonadales bacterium]
MRPCSLLGVLILLGSACQAGAGGSRASPVRVVDSTTDSIIVQVRGPVSEDAVRHLVEEVRIAPTADDTTLFSQVSEFDVDPAGRMWVYDFQVNQILLFDAAGGLLRRVGRQGAGPGEFNSNSGMAVLGDTGLAIWDSRNGRVSFFSGAGEFRTSWRMPTGFFTNDGLVTDRSGALFVKQPIARPKEGEVIGRMGLVRLGEGGTMRDSLNPPDLPVEQVNYVGVTKDGGARSSYGAPYGPSYHWSWHPDGYFVVGNGGSYEIVLARPNSKPIVIKRDVPRVPVAEEERGEGRAWITYGIRQTVRDWTWSGPDVPAVKAPLRSLFIARDGRIWATVAFPSERIPDAELAVSRDPNRPVSHFRTPLVCEVFTPDGRFLGRVSFPPRTHLVEADGNTVWALGRDENDLQAIVRYRIEPGFER